MKHGRTAVVISMAWLMCTMPALQPIAVYAESVQDSSVSLAQESTVQASPTGDALAGTVGTDADQAGESNDIGVLDGATSDASDNATENGSRRSLKSKPIPLLFWMLMRPTVRWMCPTINLNLRPFLPIRHMCKITGG